MDCCGFAKFRFLLLIASRRRFFGCFLLVCELFCVFKRVCSVFSVSFADDLFYL